MCELLNARSIVCSEMLKLSRNNQNIKMFGVPPNTRGTQSVQTCSKVFFYTYGYFVIGYHYNTTCHSKQLPVGLMVLSDGMVHFLKMKKKFNKSSKTIVWL